MTNIKWQHELVDRAVEAARKSYAPYSKFRVGAALLTAGGRCILSGCNVENASLGLTICAERAALAAAISAGFRRFKAIAVVSLGTEVSPKSSPRQEKPVVPCGACLQALAEFCGPDFIVLTATATRARKINVYTLRDLLPHAFYFRP